MADEGLAARKAAAAVLDAVLGEGRSLSSLSGAGGPLSRLPSPEDRARAQRLAVNALRHLGRADRLLKRHLRKRPALTVQNVLRLATVEMLEDGAPPHGVVNAAVSIVGGTKRIGHAAGLVNAVLRNVAQAGGEWARLPPQQMPGWLRGRLSSAYGSKVVHALERAHAAGAPVDVTPKDGNAIALAAKVGGDALPTGSVRVRDHGQISALPGYADGLWWVQDAAAALPARLLDAAPGDRVLDLCAAPGGKTLQLAAMGAEVTALDVSEDRMARVRENLARTGLSASTVVADALEWKPAAPFDAILLDAPCSATGTIRRHPELPFIRRAEDLKPLVELQARMIDRAIELLRPGGRLVFCTCSLLPEEGERQIIRATERHPRICVEADAAHLPGVEAGWLTPEGGLRLRPDYWSEIGGMDGFYMALLRCVS